MPDFITNPKRTSKVSRSLALLASGAILMFFVRMGRDDSGQPDPAEARLIAERDEQFAAERRVVRRKDRARAGWLFEEDAGRSVRMWETLRDPSLPEEDKEQLRDWLDRRNGSGGGR
jgi:hypothetical protein